MRGPAKLESDQGERYPTLSRMPPEIHPGGVKRNDDDEAGLLGVIRRKTFSPGGPEEGDSLPVTPIRSPADLSPVAQDVSGSLGKIEDTLRETRSWLDSNPVTPSYSGSEPPPLASLLQENTSPPELYGHFGTGCDWKYKRTFFEGLYGAKLTMSRPPNPPYSFFFQMYSIQVKSKTMDEKNRWVVLKRFSDFKTLHDMVRLSTRKNLSHNKYHHAYS